MNGEVFRPPRALATWGPAVLWTVVALAGYAASLQLVQAGPTVRYQHYLPPWGLDAAPGPALTLLGVEVAAVAAGLVRRRRQIATILGAIPTGRLLLLSAGLLLASSTLSRDPRVYLAELVLATAIQAVHLGAVALAALALPARALEGVRRSVDRLLGPAGETGASRLDRFSLLAALAATAISYLLAVLVYQRHPHIPDEVVYLLHARYFAAGRLGMAPPVPAAGFDIDLMFLYGGRWFSPVPPGWPAILAVGAWLGEPWLVNPVLAGVNVLLASLLLQQLYDRRTARLGVLLLLLSPWHLFMGMNLLTHEFTLTCGLAAAVAVGCWLGGGNLGWAVAGGLAAGAASLIRPLDGLAVALTLGLWCLTASSWRSRAAGLILFGLGTALAGALTLPYNAALMGSATRFPIMAYTDITYGPGTNAMGFGPNRGLGWSGLDPLPGHGPLDVLINANMNVFSIAVELLGWATGSLLPIAVLLGLGRLSSGDRRMLAVIAVVAGLHSFYWFSGGPDFGARYWYLVLVPCIALAARGIERAGAQAGPREAGRVYAAALVLLLGTALVFMPWRSVDKYYHYRNMRPDIRWIAREHDFGRSLVLIRGKRHGDYASAAVYNPLDLDADAPIYAWDKDAETRAALLQRYRDRPVWVIDGPTVTGDGYRIVAGPLAPGSPVPAGP